MCVPKCKNLKKTEQSNEPLLKLKAEILDNRIRQNKVKSRLVILTEESWRDRWHQ